MFKKLKEVAKSSETVSEINSIIKNNKEEVAALRTDINSLKNHIQEIKIGVATQTTEIKELHSLFLKSFKEELEKVKDFNKQFDGLVEDFRIQKQKMQEAVYERTSAGINKEIDRLKADVNRYNELKKDMDSISTVIINLRDEAKRFKEISEKIKKQDFELIKFTKHVKDIEKEKSNLNNKIDSLQRLISAERRRRS
ncbi:MAG: hypothetical protein U9R08_04540 [Nanoarchaeota archaeon]|nr:hypothetical protein [Nanoarchaeota archaeon]